MHPKFRIESIFIFLKTFLNGVGQIMLQQNMVTGFLFLVGIFMGSFEMGVAAILSVATGIITAKLLKYDKEETEAGLYGFSPALVGVALILNYEPTAVVWLAIIIGSAIAAMIQHFFIIRSLPAYTFPFVLVTWIILFVFNNLYVLEPSHLLNSASVPFEVEYMFGFRGVGQVIFQGDLIVGIMFVIAIVINHPIAAAYALTGSILSGVAALMLQLPSQSVFLGLFSYNAALCAIVFAGEKIRNIILALISVTLSLLIAIMMHKYNLTQLTFPFVAATVLTLAMDKGVKRYMQPKVI